MAKKRTGLGRGLGALLADDEEVVQGKKTVNEVINEVSNFHEVGIGQIETNPFQPRTHFDEDALNELSESIKVQGIIQPITVRKLSEDQYQLISGERRFQASKRAGLEKIPAYIRKANDQEMLEMAIIENVQRENLNAIEVALSYQRLIDECELKHEELGDRVGKKRATVNNYLRLLKLPPDIQASVRDKRLSMGHARALIGVDNIDTQLAIYKKVIAEELSVRKTEELVRMASEGRNAESTPSTSVKLNPELQNLQIKLSSHFGTRINIKSDASNKKGEIKIPYVSIEDLNRILEILDVKI